MERPFSRMPFPTAKASHLLDSHGPTRPTRGHWWLYFNWRVVWRSIKRASALFRESILSSCVTAIKTGQSQFATSAGGTAKDQYKMVAFKCPVISFSANDRISLQPVDAGCLLPPRPCRADRQPQHCCSRRIYPFFLTTSIANRILNNHDDLQEKSARCALVSGQNAKVSSVMALMFCTAPSLPCTA